MVTTNVTPDGSIEIGGSAPAVFVAGGGQVDGDLVVEWDFDNDGNFDDALEDITDRVMSCETSAGRDFPSALTGVAGPGQLRLTVRNTDHAFNHFNADSPLNQDGRSLATGRRVRVRTAESAPVEPVLLARDRFNRSDRPLSLTETGQAWVTQSGGFAIVNGVAQVDDTVFGDVSTTVVDVGAADYYVQASVAQINSNRDIGLTVRFVDNDNAIFVTVRPATDEIELAELTGGVLTMIEDTPFTPWEGMTLGVLAVGAEITVYVGGAPVLTGTAGNTTAELVGLTAVHNENEALRNPEWDDFAVWDALVAPVDGVLWTGDIKAVQPSVVPGYSVATVEGEGVLARAARPDVASPRLALGGAPTGALVGDTLARANLAHPPAGLDLGTITTGPVGIDDGKALEVARLFEATERGFIHETNEGAVGYHDADHRATGPVTAWFSDTAGVGQFRFRAVDPIDHRGRIVNRAIAGVAPDAPAELVGLNDSGVTSVDVLMPPVVDPGDLLLVVVANSQDGGHDWRVPPGWEVHVDRKADLGMRVYTRIADGTEAATNERFYQHDGSEAGLWVANTMRIPSWYGSLEGVTFGGVSLTDTPGQLAHSWGRAPATYIVMQTGIGSTTGGIAYSEDFTHPVGYEFPSGDIGAAASSGVPQYDVAVATSYKRDCSEGEAPTAFFAVSSTSLLETVVVGIRAYDGPHEKATLSATRAVGSEGRTATAEDTDSQDRHSSIVTHTLPALYASEDDALAVAEAVVVTFAADVPIVAIEFPATLDAAHRAQAYRRRVGDRIRLTATGTTGLGFDRDFVIEHIAHKITDGMKRWLTTWQLSPA